MGTRVPLRVAAEMRGVNPKTIRRRIAEGAITGYRFGPRLILVDLDELDQAMRPIPGAREVVPHREDPTAERDSARHVAVTLEQENAHLVNLIRALAHDLRTMHSDEAIDLNEWPNADALVTWLGAQP